MSKKIKKTKVPQTSSRIRPTPTHPSLICFSFRYYQENHPKFRVQDNPATYWLTLLNRLKALSGLSVQEVLRNRSSSLKCHPIKWEDTSEDGFGLPNEDQLVDTPYQFSLSSNEHGRVHGFFIDDVFYIVWLDPQHQLYSG